MKNTGIEACELLKEINFSGNVIPQIWYKVFVKKDLKHPKPHLLAINILSDIVYWYRPSEVRDESTGQLVGYKKKFSSDMLQRSYSQFAELFGCSCGQAKEAVVFLEKMGVIKRVFRDLVSNGIACNNILFIDLDVKSLIELTYSQNEKEEKVPAEKTQRGVCRNSDGGVQKISQRCTEIPPEGVSEFHRRDRVNFTAGGSKFPQTNTETTTKTTQEITLSSPSYSPRGNESRVKMEDGTGEVSKFLDGMGLNELKHKEMVEPIKTIMSDLLLTGKVGRNHFRSEDVKKTLRDLSVSDIDGVIDRFATQTEKENISCPDEYLKASLLKAGRTAILRNLAGKSGSEGIHCGKPSYDIDEYVRVEMEQLHEEE